MDLSHWVMRLLVVKHYCIKISHLWAQRSPSAEMVIELKGSQSHHDHSRHGDYLTWTMQWWKYVCYVQETERQCMKWNSAGGGEGEWHKGRAKGTQAQTPVCAGFPNRIISFIFILTTLEGPNMTVLKNKDYPVHCVETRFNKGHRKLFVKPFGSPRTVLSRDPELLNRTRD